MQPNLTVPLVNEEEVAETALPGRRLRWLVTPQSANRAACACGGTAPSLPTANGHALFPESLGAKHLSMCSIRVAPGETVRPAHSHPNGEEVIYIVRGCGRVLVDGAVAEVREGTAVLFPQGSVHMLQNTGAEEMKVVCFFAPPSDLGTYRFFEDVEFPA